MSELDGEVKARSPLDSFFSSSSFPFSLVVKNVNLEFDPAIPGALKLVSGFLFSSMQIPPSTGALFPTDPLLVFASKAPSAVVVVVVERDPNKLSPQLPISVKASWPRLNLGGANEYLFCFFEGTSGDIDNEDTPRSSGGREVDPSPSLSSTTEVFR